MLMLASYVWTSLFNRTQRHMNVMVFPFQIRVVLCCRTNNTVLVCLILLTGRFLDKKGLLPLLFRWGKAFYLHEVCKDNDVMLGAKMKVKECGKVFMGDLINFGKKMLWCFFFLLVAVSVLMPFETFTQYSSIAFCTANFQPKPPKRPTLPEYQ